jgi:hypothetical protein
LPEKGGEEMNDNDITKALECCRIGGDKCRFDCPYINAGTKNCVDDLLEDAINLINRQKAEIERLNAENDKLRLEMSYMKNPNSIGDIHEMGAW